MFLRKGRMRRALGTPEMQEVSAIASLSDLGESFTSGSFHWMECRSLKLAIGGWCGGRVTL